MAETTGEGHSPGRELTTEGRAGAGSSRELTAASPLSHPDIFERLRRIPSGEEPAFWPVRVITELEYVTDPGEQPDSPLTQKWAPVRESLRRVKKAYEILAYPHVKYDGWRECIQAELERSRQLHGIDQVELDDAELHILGKLAATAEVPFDPRKRVYSYSEVPLPPYIDPFGRRHMSTEQIRSELTEKED